MSGFKLVLFDDDSRAQFLPLAWTKPIADFRIGIFTIREKWELRLKSESTTATVSYLEGFNFPFVPDATKQNLWINSRIVPSGPLAFEVLSLKPNEALLKGSLVVAINNGNSIEKLPLNLKDHLDGDFSVRQCNVPAIVLHRINDLFIHNGQAIVEDFELLKGHSTEKLSNTNIVIGTHPIFIGQNVSAEACTFNTTKGPIYIGDGAEVMEGCNLRGPLAVGSNVVLKMGAKIYGDTTIGPGCKVGGEVSNTIFFGNSNKAHGGFIGNSVIGEWCNLGAATNCSNLKNTYGFVSVWNYALGGIENTGLQFHGIIMGDHAMCGINTMFNTGTVMGLCASVFGSGYQSKFIADFTWGGTEGTTDHHIEKAIKTIERVYERRKLKLSDKEILMLKFVFKQTEKLRI